MNNETILALVSAIAAALSALYAYSSSRTAQKLFSIAKAENDEKKLSIEAYLIDSALWRGQDNDTYVMFYLKFINSSSAQNSITAASLHFIAGNTNFVLESHNKIPTCLWEATSFVSSMKFEAAECRHCVIHFLIPQAIAQRDVEKYTLFCTTLRGADISLESYIMKDRTDGTSTTPHG